MEQELIFKLVAILGGSFIGGITIADVVRIIAKLVVKAKSLKAIRYNKEDKAECVAMLKESQAKEIKIDMAKELDKATNNRVAEVEKTQNEIIASLNSAVNIINAMGNCISELKSISPSAKANLQEALNGVAIKVEEIKVEEEAKVVVQEKEQISY